MTITPETAKVLLDNSTSPGPWMLNPQSCILVDDGTDNPPGPNGFVGTMWKDGHPDNEGNGHLMAAAPDLAATVAGLEWEWAAQIKERREWVFLGLYGPHEPWGPEDEVRGYNARCPLPNTRFVRRLVGPVEVIDGD